MTLRPVLVNIKALDDSAVGRFWAETLGWRVTSSEPGATAAQPVGFDWLDPVTVCVAHGAGETTTSPLVQQLIPDSRVFDAEKVGETLMDITPGLPATDNFQHWPPWRPLVVETARRTPAALW